MVTAKLAHRVATADDIPAIAALMALAIDRLQRDVLSPELIAASRAVMGLDTRLIADRTYVLVEDGGRLVGCGGWSRRATLFGADHTAARDDSPLDPVCDPARVRAMYTHPDHARRGIGRRVLGWAEAEAASAGFAHAELAATLAGVPLYAACGWTAIAPFTAGGVPMLRMGKRLTGAPTFGRQPPARSRLP